MTEQQHGITANGVYSVTEKMLQAVELREGVLLDELRSRPAPAAPTDEQCRICSTAIRERALDDICKLCGAEEYGACVLTDCPVDAYKSSIAPTAQERDAP